MEQTANSLRILIVEDVPRDADLAQRELRHAGMAGNVRVVDSRDNYLRELAVFEPDIILSDYVLPQFSGREALEIRNERAPEVPFVIVTASINEETAAECIKNGADDYVTKDHLARLALAVDGALRKKRLEKAERQAREEAERAAAEWRATFDAIQDAIFLLDADRTIRRCNKAFEELVGKPSEEIIGRPCFEVLHGTNEPVQNCPLTVLRQSQRRESATLIMDDRYLDAIVDPILDQSGVCVGAIHILSDITERQRAEAALQESEMRYRTLVEQAPEAIAIHADGVLLYINRKGAEALGADDPKELIGMSVEKLIHPTNWPAAQERIRRLLAGEAEIYPVEDRYVRLDGTSMEVESSAVPVTFQGRKAIQVISRDITERKRAEEQIRNQAALLDLAQDAIGVLDMNGHVLYWNKGCERLTGWSAAGAVGRPIVELLQPDRGAFDYAVQALLKEDHWRGELQLTTKHGQKVTGMSRWTLVRDEHNRPNSVLVIHTDITEQKKMEAQFLRSQRMESVGRLAGGIAHDLNNILSPIVMAVPLLRESLASPEDQSVLETVEKSAQRGADILRQLLTFARGTDGRKIPVPPSHLLKEMKAIIGETFPKLIVPRVELPDNLWAILGDPTQLHQVLLNLCVNAGDAMPSGGTLTLSAENVTLDDCYARMNPEARPGPYVVLGVADTGVGMPPEIVGKIFDPFFTTKAPDRGTGLGLATVLGIVRSHSGFIHVDSQLGHGTRFKVYLPAVLASGAAPDKAITRPMPVGHGELILLIDDEPSIRSITSQILEKNGYRILVAKEGTEAVALFTEYRDGIEAVLTDLMMPIMDGAATIRVLRGMSPLLKIIAASGVASKPKLADVADLPIQAFLQKPYTAETLLVTLQRVLGAGK